MNVVPLTAPGPDPAHRARRQPPDSAGPARTPGRLPGVDVLRALAILGMVWAHFVVNGWLSPASPEQPPSAALSWVDGLLGTRSREIFFLLAGLSAALMTGGFQGYAGRARSQALKRLAVRAVVLFVLALVLGWTGNWDVQILHYYALWLLLLLPLSLLRARTLLVLAGLLAVAAPAFKIAADHAGTAWPFLPATVDLSSMPRQLHGGFALLVHPGDWWPTLQHVVFGMTATEGQDTVSVLPFLVLGLALGKLDLHSRAVRRRLLAVGAGTAVATVLVSLLAMYPLGAAQAVDDYRDPPPIAAPAAPGAPGADADGPPELPPLPKAPWQELVTMGHPGPAEKTLSATEGVTVLGLIAALLGGLLTLLDKPLARRLLHPVTAFGSMALTWYFAHLIVLGWFHGTPGPEGYPPGRSALSFAVFVAVALAVSVLWRRFFRRGPLEWLTHRVIVAAVPGRRDGGAAHGR